MSPVVAGRIGSDEQKSAAQVERELEAAYRVIWILLQRKFGGEAFISNEEYAAACRPWVTSQVGAEGIQLRAR